MLGRRDFSREKCWEGLFVKNLPGYVSVSPGRITRFYMSQVRFRLHTERERQRGRQTETERDLS